MGKLGKRKFTVLPKINKKKSDGYSDNDENSKNGASNSVDDEHEVDREDGDKQDSSSKKQKLSIGAGKATTQEHDSESNESDDMPLNGSKASSSKASPQTKQKKISKSKGKVPAAEKHQNKKISAKPDDKEKDETDDESGEAEFEVEAIVGHKTKNGESFFLVHWKGYGKDDDSWEPEADLNCNDLIEEYLKKTNPKKGTGAIKKSPAGVNVGRGRKLNKKIVSDPEKEWAVERIVDFVDDDEQGGLYRIRWKGFGAKEDTWEPESNLSCEGLIEKFKKSMEAHRNVDAKQLRESPKKTKRLVNETIPRTNFHNRIERSSKRSAAKNRVFYGEE
ncbi:M-phase phosphoprotein 8 [Drosophila grimshawi]|uniref:GH24044 n=1 Tax=Drosophila grimshawi TaxID=7222 RepID=B4JP17_DROGR|nr:M-phase phosphoprotein 8 [Drosophila grimshawi]EDV92460.1 GH24044 [Drosophila grimshawi]